MAGITEIDILLKNMNPVLCEKDYVFCVLEGKIDSKILELNPVGIFQEEEGVTVILEKGTALKNSLPFESVLKKITLLVHSSLEAVGLTAAFSKALGDHNISANVVAGYYHDHIFVPEVDAKNAHQVLLDLAKESG